MKNFCLPLVASVLFQSCATSGAKRPREHGLDGQPSVAIDASDTSDATPSTIWSPGQREMNASYYLLVAEQLSLKGDMAKALPLYRAAYALDPNPVLGAKTVSAEASLGQMDSALPEARKMTLLYPKNARLHLLYGQLLAKQGVYDDAVTQLERAISLDPKDENAYLQLMEAHQQAHHIDRAVSVAERLVKAAPESAAGWALMARLLLAEDHKKEALNPARHAYELQSSTPELVLLYALTLDLNGKPADAIKMYEQLYRLEPLDDELTERMIGLYQEVGDLNDALELLDGLAKQPGGNKPGVQLQRALVLWQLQRFNDAAAVLDKLAKEHPTIDRLQYMAGLGQEKIKHFDVALKIYAALPAESQFKQDAQLRTVVIYRELRRYDEAMKGLSALLNETPNPEIYELGAQILEDQNKPADAVKLLQNGTKKLPDSSRLVFLLGVFDERTGDVAGCIEAMRRVIALEPSNSTAYNYLGYLYAERGENLDEAERLIQKALEIKPNDGYYLDSLAWVYFRKGQYAKAQKLLEEALAALPNEGEVLEHLGDVAKAQGRSKDALSYYERALRGKLENDERVQVEGKVKGMGGTLSAESS